MDMDPLAEVNKLVLGTCLGLTQIRTEQNEFCMSDLRDLHARNRMFPTTFALSSIELMLKCSAFGANRQAETHAQHMAYELRNAGLQQYCLLSWLRRTVLRHFAREVIKCQRPEMEEGGDEASLITDPSKNLSERRQECQDSRHSQTVKRRTMTKIMSRSMVWLDKDSSAMLCTGILLAL